MKKDYNSDPMIFISDEVDHNRIDDSTVMHNGCKIFGNETLICSNVELGLEAPVTIKNCFVGPNVKLKGGYFENAVFLEGATAGSGAHVRGGTIFEEQASIAHTVGLKQTILFPYVTLGSLINFCDCLMAGGTSRKNHSAVGSSYIHFNYTPNQDKATASLIGDVPKGVMLDQNPIFLGGQGGLVGPCRIAYGTVIAAGSVHRKDQLTADRLVFDGCSRGGSVPYDTGVYRSVKRQAVSNVIYIANLLALMTWYNHVRRRFINEQFPQPLYDGLIAVLNLAIDERVKQFNRFCEKLKQSSVLYVQQTGNNSSTLVLQKEQLYRRRDQVGAVVRQYLDRIEMGESRTFSSLIDAKIQTVGYRYIDVVKSLDSTARQEGAAWLQGIVDDVSKQIMALFPVLC